MVQFAHTIRARRLFVVVGVLLAGLCVVAPLKATANLYDEGTYLVSAERILHGNIPYRDFFFFKPPGQIYVLAALYRAFGATVLTGRVYDVLIRFALACLAGLLVWKQAGSIRAVFTTLIVAILIATDGAAIYPIYAALLLSLIPLLLLTWGPAPTRPTIAAAGMLVALALLLRWDFGLYAALACAVALAVHPHRPLMRCRGARMDLTYVALFAGSAASITLLLYGLVALRSGLRPLIAQVFVFPITVQPSYRWHAYPSPWLPLTLAAARPHHFVETGLAVRSWLGFYFPILLYGAVLARFAWLAHRRTLHLDAHAWSALALALLGSLLLTQALNRYDLVHVIPSLVVMAPLLAILSAPGCRTLRAPTARSTAAHATTARPTRLEACFSAALVAVALIFVIPSTVRIANDLRRTPPNACFSNLPKAGCVKVNDDLEQAVTFLQAHSAQSLPIFVGLQRHDMIYTSDMLFYFLADRPSLTRYQLLEPGVATTAAVQDGIIADLATHAAEQIVLVNMPPPANPEPNLSSVSSRVHNLDDFIRTHYAREATFGRWSIWQNSRQAGPAGSASHG